MRKTREEKAITLIALIITIVVLLILAVVAINAVTGDGIIQHAVNAKEDYEQAQDKENSMLSYYEKYLESQGGADIWDGKTSQKPEMKDGNWYIYTCSEFKFFADFVNKTPGLDTTGIEEITADTTVYLMSNLDLGARQTDGKLTEGSAWEPIGIDSNKSFIGTFEGNNHYVKGMYINKESDFAGIFGYSTNTIKNLTIKDGYIENAGICVGGIVGRGEVIINCHNINTVVKQTASYKIGGITGQAKMIENCTNTGTIIGESVLDVQTDAGGIVGLLAANGSIKKCKNSGNITGIGERIGGIAGCLNNSATIDSCSNVSQVVGVAHVAGIAGVASSENGVNNLNLSNCYNIGNIEGQAYIGGILGSISEAGGLIKGCYNAGTMIGNEDIGAIIGKLGTVKEIVQENTIEKCYYLEGSSEVGVSNYSNEENIVKMITDKMKTEALADLLNTATQTGAWAGVDGQYPKLSWE